MAQDALLKTISSSISEAEAMAVLQRWIKQACINAGIIPAT